MPEPSLSERVIHFSRFLKNHGYRIFPSAISDALIGIGVIDISSREDFRSVIRASFTTNELEWRLFDELFENFFKETERETGREEGEQREKDSRQEGTGNEYHLAEKEPEQTAPCEEIQEKGKETIEGRIYSPVSLLEKKDLGRFQKGDMRFARLILKNLMSPFRAAPIRRRKKSRKPGDIDFRAVTRRSLEAGGFPLQLLYKKRRKRLKRLVILADVSGSMDRYARFVMPFLLGLKGVGPKTEVFVFSTSLTAITPIIRKYPLDKALELIAEEVPAWSGGTRIGYSLHQFNRRHGIRLVNDRTVIVILSDGWDLGGKDLLKREMESLHQKAHAVLWLNPLAGDPGYRPVCKGMQAALPFVDYFLPADSLRSLKRVGRTLTRIMVHG